MSKKYLNPDNLFSSRQYGFSQGVVCQGGKTVFLSGQVGWDENQQIIGPGDLRTQTWQTFKNIGIALESAGGALADVVSMRIYIVSERLDESHHIREALQTFFPGDSPPATTWIGVHSLANKDFLIEIEAIAVLE